MKVVLSKKAEKDYSRLPKNVKGRIVKKFDLLGKEAFAGKKLSGEYGGLYSLKVWPYRIIYKIEKNKFIAIIRILHRQGVYKN
jgi:addiction module RelE/StbE family toxin